MGADRKYEEETRKLKMVQNDLERVTDRSEEYEASILKTEKQLKNLQSELKDVEKISSQNLDREENYENQISTLIENLKNAETRAEFAEKTVDYLEDQLYIEKKTFKEINEKLDKTLGDMIE